MLAVSGDKIPQHFTEQEQKDCSMLLGFSMAPKMTPPSSNRSDLCYIVLNSTVLSRPVIKISDPSMHAEEPGRLEEIVSNRQRHRACVATGQRTGSECGINLGIHHRCIRGRFHMVWRGDDFLVAARERQYRMTAVW